MNMRIFRNVSRILIALVFIFSGFVKVIDPLGFAYKINDYFEAFGMGFLSSFSLFFSIIMCTAELLIGLNLLLKIRMKMTAWALFLFMCYFTVFTLITAITNPVTDCGCFGDALIITNWQTFFKNLIFMIPALVVFLQRENFDDVFSTSVQWLLTGMLLLGSVALSLHCYYNLPIIDFRPYKPGVNIPYSMKIPEGEPVDEYQTVLIYEKDGLQEEFTLDSERAPWSDSTWKWVETKNLLIRKGFVPPIHDFSLSQSGGIDITDEVLSDQGYSFLVAAYNLEKASKKGMENVNAFASEAIEMGYKVYGMTASTSGVVDETKRKLNPEFEFYTTDDITLKTMIRSNPGLILIKEGNILGKWHYRNIPGEDFFNSELISAAMTEQVKSEKNRLILAVILLIGALTLLMELLRMKFNKYQGKI